eukprot:TRINITY_DN8581_c0_g1_i13.p1 TRINITY_DN8581_c0_g1~~TRINITY_DN8581_c0_g1_i13.p1  ORF type:complete len:571 (-),score=203.85 TRINITY_DN8581_c0_g1_i13:192-1904(-)
MDSKPSIVIEIEPTPKGYTVTQITGLPQKITFPAATPESNKIQISFPARINPTLENQAIPANSIKSEQSSQPKSENYEVYPHAQITPNMHQSMTPMEVQKEEDKETHVIAEEKASSGTGQLNLAEIKRYPMVFPSCAEWFDVNTIHEIEQQALPEYFCGKFSAKTPQIYMEYRNYIIKLYRANPHGYLSATVCRRHLAGDVCGIFRIHAFLEHWGIINFNVDSYLKPHKAIMVKVEGVDAESLLNMEEAKAANSGLSFAGAAKLLGASKHPNCSQCGQPCGFIWFKHSIEASYILCEPCFEKKKETNSAEGFEICSVQPEIPAAEKDEWSQEELLFLLSCIEKHKDEWDKTVEEMGLQGYRRSKQDCIAKFLGLPIAESQSSKISATVAEVPSKRPGDNCFYDISNPIFIQIGLFAKELERCTSEEAKKSYALRKQGTETEQKAISEHRILSKETVEKIKAKTARRAKKLARKEVREIRRLVGLVLEAQMKKVECKMDYFNEFDSLLNNERQQIKALQAQVFAERLNLSMARFESIIQGRRRSFDNSRKGSIVSEQKGSALSPQLEPKHL